MGGYARLYANPFTADTVGLPVFPSPPSSKVTAWARGTFATGPSGFGYIAGSPATASDAVTLFTTTSSYAVTPTDSIQVSGTGVVPGSLSNLPVVASALGDDNKLKARVVLYAMRCRFIGKQTDLGGIVYPFVHPSHGSIVGYTESSLNSQESFRSVPVGRNWVTIVWSPIHRTELDFYHTPTPPTHVSDDVQSQVVQMCLYVRSSASQLFEYEVVEHIEYIGTASGMTRTANPTPVPALADRIDQLQEPIYAIRSGPSLEGIVRASSGIAEILGAGARGFLGGRRASLMNISAPRMRPLRDEI